MNVERLQTIEDILFEQLKKADSENNCNVILETAKVLIEIERINRS